MTRFRRVLTMLTASFMLAGAVMIAAQRTADVALRAAIETETVRGDVRGAIEQYERIVETYGNSDRGIAAQALLRLADAYQTLGDAEAKSAYERLLREFGDQREQAAIASARLAAKQRSAGVASRKLFESATLSFPYEAVSADGRYIAYPSIQPGPRGLMIRSVASGQERQLTNYGTSQLATTSAFSPDSRMIAFRVSKGPDAQDLRIIRTDGTGERVIFENENVTASHPHDWSPDGKHVLAVLSTKDRSRQISLISVSDGSVRRIKTSDWRLGPPDDALFSRDGRHIVYDQLQQEGASAADIFLLAADGSREVRLVEHPADDKVVGWAPDGRLVFTSNRSGTRDLYALRVSDARAEGEPDLIQRDVPGLSHRVTRTGALHYIGFHKVNGAYVVSLDVENGKLAAPPVPVTETVRDYNWTPAFSPDGKQVAVISFREVGKMYVIIKSLTSNEEREIYAKGLRVAYDVLWHPDGKSLLLRGNDEGFQWGIHRLDLATGRLEEPLLKAGENNLGQFELSPDGTFLYYNFREPSAKNSTLRSRNLMTGEERELYHTEMTGGSDLTFALAPGGKRIALVDNNWNKPDAASWIVLDLENGKTRSIPNISQGTFAPVWTPDGKYLVFTSGRRWFRASVEDGSLTELGPAAAGIGGTKRMHPDGSRLAFFTIKEISEFWVMQNLFPEQVGSR